MADSINEIINKLEKRLRNLESKTLGSVVISRLTPANGVTGDFLAKASSTDYDVEWRTGYLYSTTLYYTSSGTFTFSPATYPDLKAVRVRLVGGGGGGGGCALTGAGQSAGGGSGGGAGYSEEFIVMDSSTASVTVTVGAGGANGAAGANNGSAGGTSSFGAYLSATGGSAGGGDLASTAPVYGASGASPGAGSGGNLNLSGSAGSRSFSIDIDGISMYWPYGGGSALSPQAFMQAIASGTAGTNGLSYGMGGGGGTNTESQVARAGGDGSAGIVIVDVFV